jgi:hypothetical protein
MRITRNQLRQLIREAISEMTQRHPLDWDEDGNVDWGELEALYSQKDDKSVMWKDGWNDGFTGAEYDVEPAHPDDPDYMAGFRVGSAIWTG